MISSTLSPPRPAHSSQMDQNGGAMKESGRLLLLLLSSDAFQPQAALYRTIQHCCPGQGTQLGSALCCSLVIIYWGNLLFICIWGIFALEDDFFSCFIDGLLIESQQFIWPTESPVAQPVTATERELRAGELCHQIRTQLKHIFV